MFTLAWQRPELWQSHIVLLVLVLLVLARGFRCVDLFLFDHGSVGLCRVADVVTTLVYMVGAFVSVPVFIHSIKQDENAQRRCCYDADHHPRGTARLPEDLLCSWVTLWSSTSGIGCKTKKQDYCKKAMFYVSSLLWPYWCNEWEHAFFYLHVQMNISNIIDIKTDDFQSTCWLKWLSHQIEKRAVRQWIEHNRMKWHIMAKIRGPSECLSAAWSDTLSV